MSFRAENFISSNCLRCHERPRAYRDSSSVNLRSRWYWAPCHWGGASENPMGECLMRAVVMRGHWSSRIPLKAPGPGEWVC